MKRLVVQEVCEHGEVDSHSIYQHPDDGFCLGGPETVLDPEKALQGLWISGSPMVPWRFARVQDVLDALGGSDE